jgi:hypothetical protein
MTVLYIAFGFVALWLLAEVLMQYKARLRWRLLAFAGFLGVVAGVVLPSVLVIAIGATAFALGQILVTLSFRKGFEAGWALRRGGASARQSEGQDKGKGKGKSRRRRGSAAAAAAAPALQVTALEYGPEPATSEADPDADTPEPDAVYSPQPLPEETGTYGIQSFLPGSGEDPAQTAAFASPYTTAEQDAHQYASYDPHTQGGYDYGTGYPGGEQQVYAAYSDPYIGTGGGVVPPQPYDYGQYTAYTPDPYAQQQYAMDTPPGGVWVPQQRDVAQPYPAEDQNQQQGYPYQGTDEYGGQYRY